MAEGQLAGAVRAGLKKGGFELDDTAFATDADVLEFCERAAAIIGPRSGSSSPSRRFISPEEEKALTRADRGIVNDIVSRILDRVPNLTSEQRFAIQDSLEEEIKNARRTTLRAFYRIAQGVGAFLVALQALESFGVSFGDIYGRVMGDANLLPGTLDTNTSIRNPNSEEKYFDKGHNKDSVYFDKDPDPSGSYKGQGLVTAFVNVNGYAF